jgi:hypothetical protein
MTSLQRQFFSLIPHRFAVNIRPSSTRYCVSSYSKSLIYRSISQLPNAWPIFAPHLIWISVGPPNTAVYPGSTRSYLPGYTTAQHLRLMHEVLGQMLGTGFDPGLWGSVSVSQLFPHISLHIVHILIYTVYPGSSRSYLPGYTTAQHLRLMHGGPDRMLDTGFDPGL